ncbi:MAG: aldehyde dehydrogenase family protein [Sinobacteraceae bacterium]|nr:aldehyde dehydrogenase family protein [Nevskiaceae bacterium]
MDRHLHWIDGGDRAPLAGQFFEVRDPDNDRPFALAARGSAADVDAAVNAAQVAFAVYSRMPVGVREAILSRAAALLERDADEFAALMIQEVGSPVGKARNEIQRSIEMFRAAAGSTRYLAGKTLPSDTPDKMNLTLRVPVGVIASITPFNVPLGKGVRLSAVPLAFGNTVVMLPSEESPLMALRLARLYAEAGLPPGCLNIVTGFGHEVGDSLTGHPHVRSITFTGSTRVGAHIREIAARSGKKLTLELGGKSPLVVLDDADLPRAVAAAVQGSFGNQGQICMASSRVYVQRGIAASFIERFVAATRELRMGDLRDPATMIGPIINARQRERIAAHIDDALAKGARAECGARWVGHRCEPTVLTGVTREMACFSEETFGPVTAVHTVDTFEEALILANDTRYGLSAAIFTANLDHAMTYAMRIGSGMVHVNGSTSQAEPHVPFGGNGDSGFGREGPEYDMEAMTEWKWISLQLRPTR